MNAPKQPAKDVPPGKTRIRLYNPNGSIYFQGEFPAAHVEALHQARKRRRVSFQQIVHEVFDLGTVSDEPRPLLILPPPLPPEDSQEQKAKPSVAPPAAKPLPPPQREIPRDSSHQLPPPPLTIAEFAAQVRRDPQSIRRWVKNGILVGRNIRGRVLIPRSELEGFAIEGAVPKPGPKKGSRRRA